MEDTIKHLKSIKAFEEVPQEQLEWLTAKGKCVTFSKGDYAFKKGDPIDRMFIVLKGNFSLKSQQNGNTRVIGTLDEHSITGLLPYSRASNANGVAEATEIAEVLSLHKDHFQEMIHNHHELTTALVHVMSTRIRDFTKMQQQNDKIMALGKLSAGLAHELNNPSAAVVRSARTLRKHLSLLPENFKSVIKIKMDDGQVEAINNLLFKKVKGGTKNFAMMEKSEMEDAIAERLEKIGFEDGYDLAENFVDFGFEKADFDAILQHVTDSDLKPVIGWLNQILITEKLVNEIEDASQRINDLVGSVKSYTHMDQAPEKQEADIHMGINNTLTMLNHKIKKANVEVIKKYQQDLVKPQIYISEMNQVWTNLIDNAIDALEDTDNRQLIIETKEDEDFVNISIIDSGKGIPEDILDQIFDPFYTTKAIGKGTGLGLDVVQQIINQHNGTIKVQSKPGCTEFRICLPIK